MTLMRQKDIIEPFEIFAPHATDFYKVGHGPLYPEGTNFAYSNFTARSDKNFIGSKSCSSLYDNKVVVYGTTAVWKEIHARWDKTFFNVPKEQAVARYKRRMDLSLGKGVVPTKALEELHDLQFLPLAILSIDEGERVPMRVPLFVVYNTLNGFSWLVNYLETTSSSNVWKTICNATIAFEYRRIFEHYARLTGGSPIDVLYQGHDFAYRGMSGDHDAARSNSGHLMFFRGTDTIPAIDYVEYFYSNGLTDEPIGESVVATEHAVATANILSRLHHRLKGRDPQLFSSDELNAMRLECEREFIIEIISEKVSSGICSLVCDSFDFWGVLRLLPELRGVIEARGVNDYGLSKVVIRPDSGDPILIVSGYRVVPTEYKTKGDFASEVLNPVALAEEYDAVCIDGKYYEFGVQYDGFEEERGEIFVDRELSIEEVQGAVETLWNSFGGTVTDKGFKKVWDRVGLIYGDSISVDRAETILKRLMAKGFCSTNIVFGIGSYTYQMNTRDTFGKAIKATAIAILDQLIELYKDPATGDKIKKSACGLLKVVKEDGEYVLHDQQPLLNQVIEESSGELTLMYKDGVFYKNPTFVEIRGKIDAQFV